MADERVRVRVVGVVVEPLTHEEGHWCRPCGLSTGLRIWVAVRSDFGMHLQSRLVCQECGSRDILLDPDAAAG